MMSIDVHVVVPSLPESISLMTSVRGDSLLKCVTASLCAWSMACCILGHVEQAQKQFCYDR